MASLVVDTSAVVKRYIVEPGSDVVRGLLRPRHSNDIYIAHITVVEGVSAIARRARRGDVSHGDVRVAYARRPRGEACSRRPSSLRQMARMGSLV